jgi:GTP-binding protein EngB required for normal cell division
VLRQFTSSRVVRAQAKTVEDATKPDSHKIINTLHEVQDILGTSLAFSRICMVGEQSAGKTSVLETIIGADISVKDDTIATRRPLLLTLIRGPKNSTMYAQFADGEKMYSFTDVKRRIALDNEVVGGVSDQPILLTIYSPDVFDTILVDLPGYIVSNPDDPTLPKKIKEINHAYISDKRNVLCLTQSATADPATSFALAQVAEADTDNSRTLGVLTKMDMVGKNLKNLQLMLQNQRFPLPLGRVGIRCRSQQEQLDGLSFFELGEIEHKFLEESGLNAVPFVRVGIETLRKTLSDINVARLAEEIPSILAQLDAKIGAIKQSQGLISRLMGEKDLTTVSRELHTIAATLHKASDPRRDLEERVRNRVKAAVNQTVANVYKNDPFDYGATSPTVRLTAVDPLVKAATATLKATGFDGTNFTRLDKFQEILIYGGETHVDGINQKLLGSLQERAMQIGVASAFVRMVLPENPRKARARWVNDLEHFVDRLVQGEKIVDGCFEAFMAEITQSISMARSGGQAPSDLSVAFFQFVLNKIALQKHQSGLRHEVEGMVMRERRPDADLLVLTRMLVLGQPDYLKAPSPCRLDHGPKKVGEASPSKGRGAVESRGGLMPIPRTACVCLTKIGLGPTWTPSRLG